MADNPFITEISLIDYLTKGEEKDFPQGNEKKPYKDRYIELNKLFSDFPVEMGAMKSAYDQQLKDLNTQLENILNIPDRSEQTHKAYELIEENSTIFLNKHGAEHVSKVTERAFDIIKCFDRSFPSFYEIFLLLCSISVHDVGNIFGRTNHEKSIYKLINSTCNNIIDDTIERKVISRIAGVHSGRIKGSKDTISCLKEKYTVNNIEIREQMLASILRFADELADDNTRANEPALKYNIVGEASEIFHIYSSTLHTVKLQQNPVNNAWDVVLKFQFDEETAKKQFKKGSTNIYLLDEIYQRTFKMEQERIYCMRFLRIYCSIESINVEITIDNDEDVFDLKTIKYVLQEKGYPDSQYNTIKDVNKDILTGEEMAKELRKQGRGEKDE